MSKEEIAAAISRWEYEWKHGGWPGKRKPDILEIIRLFKQMLESKPR
jgi:hypothetical protein